MDCWTCRSNSGGQRISPGPTIFEGAYWLVEHAYPVRQIGWLVAVLKRHVEALHELTPAEFAELGPVLACATRLLAETLGGQKEYLACYAEAEHFHHVHVHVVAKAQDWPPEWLGPKSFALLKVTAAEAASPAAVAAFCERLRAQWPR